MRSVQAISHHPNVERLASKMRDSTVSRQQQAITQAITPDGKVRADRIDGFIPPHVLPLDAMERGTVVTIDPASIASGRTVDVTVTLPDARENDVITLGPPSTLEVGLIAFGFVSADGVVTIRLMNATAASLNPASGEWKIVVSR